MATGLTGDGVTFFQIATQMHAIILEGKGMRHSSGRSCLAHCKRIYKLKGNREFVLAEMQKMKVALMVRRQKGLA